MDLSVGDTLVHKSSKEKLIVLGGGISEVIENYHVRRYIRVSRGDEHFQLSEDHLYKYTHVLKRKEGWYWCYISGEWVIRHYHPEKNRLGTSAKWHNYKESVYEKISNRIPEPGEKS